MNMFRFLTLFLLIIFCSDVFAKNFGIFGTVYLIEEEDFRDFIYRKLEELQKNGELVKMQKKFITNVVDHSLRPEPVKNLTTTEYPKIFYYDPTFILDRNIETEDGKILFFKGTQINPLNKIQLHSVLFFLNGDDKRQIKWALSTNKKYNYVKYILVQGNVKEITEALKNRVYFDQYGKIVHKFKIEHLPCVVKQEGERLKIQEFRLEGTNQ